MKREELFNEIAAKQMWRLIITGVAIFAVFAAVFIKALLLGEFN